MFLHLLGPYVEPFSKGPIRPFTPRSSCPEHPHRRESTTHEVRNNPPPDKGTTFFGEQGGSLRDLHLQKRLFPAPVSGLISWTRKQTHGEQRKPLFSERVWCAAWNLFSPSPVQEAAALCRGAAKNSSTTFAVVYALCQDLVPFKLEFSFCPWVAFAAPAAQKNSAVPAVYSATLHCAHKNVFFGFWSGVFCSWGRGRLSLITILKLTHCGEGS